MFLGGPIAKYHNHDPECRRRFAHLRAGRSWPPPRSHASASAALVALLKEPDSELEPRLALISSSVDHHDYFMIPQVFRLSMLMPKPGNSGNISRTSRMLSGSSKTTLTKR